MFVNLLEVPLQARETETPLEKLKLHRHLAQVGRALLQVLGTELETGKSYIRGSRGSRTKQPRTGLPCGRQSGTRDGREPDQLVSPPDGHRRGQTRNVLGSLGRA